MNMKKIKKGPIITCLSILFAGLIFTTGCKKKSDGSPEAGPVPEVATGNYNNVLLNTIEFSGNVTADHGYIISKRGFCWSGVNQAPTIANDTNGSPESRSSSFNDTLKGLKGQTHYFIRAYATNINGTGYGSIVEVTTIDSTITDVDNNHYRIVQIGTQVWMAENLRTIKLNDGTSIPLVTDANEWSALSTPGYCWYSNDASNKSTYGALYNWYSVNTGKLAPPGWHIPTDNEWNALTDFLGGPYLAGGKLKETGTVHWTSPNTGATNSSGFTALPCGERTSFGVFSDFANMCYFWSATIFLADDEPWFRDLRYDSGTFAYGLFDKIHGASIRCIRD
jgi:uncharacterized protein (TIGR02145 family)